MGFADSFNFITGGPTSNSKKNTRDRVARENWDEIGGADRNATFRAQYEDPTNPNYKGPGYVVTIGDDGHATAMLVDADANAQWKNAGAAVPAPDLDALTAETLAATGQAPPTRNVDPLAAFQGAGALTTGTAPGVAPRDAAGGQFGTSVNAGGQTAAGLSAAANLPPAGATTPAAPGAPTVNTEAINESVSGIDAYQNTLVAMAEDNTGLSAAEAQLNKATELANIQAGIATDASQRAALGQARSARNRGDRAFLEQQAIGESAFIGQDAARNKALTDAQARGDLAEVRAIEEDFDRNFKLKAIETAAGLGLNVAALKVDIAKADLGSLTNALNNDAAFKQLGLQLDQRQAEQILAFTQGMAALQFNYDKMTVDDQNATDALLMQKYGIDQQTMLALKQMKDARKMNWNQFLAGAATGATQALATKAFSDQRVKHDINPVRAEELDELLTALKSETYDYVDEDRHGGGRQGRRFGFMAQDLEKTRLGKAMVAEDLFGTKQVDTGAVAMAAASGLAHVYDRLKGLEAAVK